MNYKELSGRKFDAAADDYDSKSAEFYHICKLNYTEVRNEKASAILDAGCGTGALTEMLAEAMPHTIFTGINLSKNMIKKTDNKNIKNAQFIVGDCENLPFSNESFDIVIYAMSIHHYPNPESFIKTCFGY